ncbi:MAG: YggT family protein [Frankiaceae bacterium]|nr:YggT family protein [Frankiaceae bacterium]MBV9870013.1 YggT family protein [Frankiaceae bacterium]
MLWIFVGLMFLRFVMDWVMMFARNFRPSGVVAASLELAYTVTDPPIRALRRVIPPLRVGNAAIDLAFMVLIIAAFILISVLTPYT